MKRKKKSGKKLSTPRKKSLLKRHNVQVPFVRPGTIMSVNLPWENKRYKMELMDVGPRRIDWDKPGGRKYSVLPRQAANVKYLEGPNSGKITTILLDDPRFKIKYIEKIGKKSSAMQSLDQIRRTVSKRQFKQWKTEKNIPHYHAEN